MIIIKTYDHIKELRESCKLTAYILNEIKLAIKPGISTYYLNELAEELTKELGVAPGFKGYRGFPFAICASKNEEIVHGFPNKEPLEEGDIISIDFGVIRNGWYGDSAFTAPVGKISDEAKYLIDTVENSFKTALNEAYAYKRVGDISGAIQNFVESRGLYVVKDFVGHGVGKNLHEEPSIPNFGKKETGVMLKPGMVIAIEPIIAIGSSGNIISKNGWTAVTKNKTLSAHHENTILITEGKPEILTSVL